MVPREIDEGVAFMESRSPCSAIYLEENSASGSATMPSNDLSPHSFDAARSANGM